MKNRNIQKILNYLFYLIPWFLSSIFFKIDTSYYQELSKPIFAPPKIFFPIIWTILYLLIAYAIQKTKEKTTNYKIYLLINYLSNQLFPFCFFTIKNNFLAMTDTIIVFISSLYLYLETKEIDQQNTKYLLPYIAWNLFALILISTIYIMN
mgnify:FL=1